MKRTKVLLLTLALFGSTGCETPVADPGPKIAAVLDGLPSAWNARDASRWVANFSPMSDFTNILGMHFEDRAANEARHATLFETIFSESRLEAEVLEIRVLGDDAAIAEVGFRLVGYERLPPGVTETVPGELHTRLITVLERVEEEWRIVAAQNTAILPVAFSSGTG